MKLSYTLITSLLLLPFWGLGGFIQAQTPFNTFLESGIKQIKAGNFEEAIVEFDQALFYAPNHPEVLLNRGIAKSQLHRWQSAREDFDKVLLYNPQNANALQKRGLVKMRLGYFTEAGQDFSRLLQVFPQSAQLYFLRAEACYQARLQGIKYPYLFIVEDYSKAINLDPKMSLAYERRAEARLDSVKSSLRIPKTAELESICADWQQAQQLGNTAANNRRQSECGQAMHQNLAQKIYDTGQIIREQGNLPHALLFYQTILQMGWTDSPYFFKAFQAGAEVKIALRNYQDAVLDLSQIITLNDPSSTHAQSAYYSRAHCHFQLENFQQALKDLDKTIELGYQYAWAYLLRGKIQQKIGNTPAARKDWQVAEKSGNIEAKELLKKK
jgi:tetratricopeptide (TPR) repeat protein